MKALEFKGAAEITDAGIKKHFRNFEPWQAIFELVWNGFDAKAESISIKIYENGLGGIASILISDDGQGIDFNNTKDNFEKFNESSKKDDYDLHGLHGRGRLAFHVLCNQAIWYTRHEAGDAKIEIKSSDIKNFSGMKLERPEDQHILLTDKNSGTCVELSGFNKILPEDRALLDKLAIEFGWYLALNEKKSLFLNGVEVSAPPHDIHSNVLFLDSWEFSIRVIRWYSKPSSEKSYNYLLNEDGRVVYKEYSSFNKKPNFFVSSYVVSKWANNFEPLDDDLLTHYDFSKSSPLWRKLCSNLNFFIQEIYENFLREFVDKEIEKMEQEGAFPDYSNINKDYAIWRRKNTIDLVRSIYIADPSLFRSLKSKQKKILIRLLDKLSISNENDSLLEVLDSVLDLNNVALEKFSSQIQKTRLENIVSTIEVLQKRELVIQKLREIMNNHFESVLETPDLQKIIENHTWLFGSAYEILGAEEDSFTSIIKSLRDKIPEINKIDQSDIDGELYIEGAQRQVDLFLARKKPTLDSDGKKIYRCIIVEIKRPSISLNQKHLRQLEEYAAIISKYPQFQSEYLRFELILIGRKISEKDYLIPSRLEGFKSQGEFGLVANDGKIKSYVKNWYTIFDEFDLSNQYLLEQLKTSRDALSAFSTQELIKDLQVKPEAD